MLPLFALSVVLFFCCAEGAPSFGQSPARSAGTSDEIALRNKERVSLAGMGYFDVYPFPVVVYADGLKKVPNWKRNNH